MRRVKSAVVLAGLFLVPACLAFAAGGASGGEEEITGLLLALAVVLLAAKVGGHLAQGLGQPPVLGELLAGIVLGALAAAGVPGLGIIPQDPSLSALAQLGVLLLLFQVGLESTVREMLQVGLSALRVAVLGMLGPFALGWAVSAWLLPDHSFYTHVFLGATLTATSVGITARVFKDVDRGGTPEARIVLGAAVLDDVLGLMVLAVVTSAIRGAGTGEPFSFSMVGTVVVKAAAFLITGLVLGVILTPTLFRLASALSGSGVLLSTGLGFCFLFSYAAARVGLAPIVGAYTAGLILEPLHFLPFARRGEPEFQDLLQPLAAFLVPIFFVRMGMQLDVGALMRPEILSLSLLLTAAAILGKLMSGLGVTDPAVDRLSVGIGMVPRGEVGLIFAQLGLSLTIGGRPVVDPGTYAALTVMVFFTTIITPPALKWSLRRGVPLPPGPGQPEPETT